MSPLPLRFFRPLLVLAIGLCAAPLAAQTVYRCGATFSHVPCDETARPMKGLAAGGGTSAGETDVRELCVAAIKQQVRFNDPDALKVVTTAPPKPDIVEFQGKRLMGFVLALQLNARLPSGSYEGPKTYQCYTSEDRRRVLRVEQSGG